MSRNTLLLALAAIFTLPALAQDKSITFDNVTPNKTVRLQNGGTLSIAVDGNVTAKCLNADADPANCDDIGTGGGVGTPTVSLAGGNFSQTADGNNAYPAGTTFTLTPTVSNAEACIRLLEAGTPVNVSGWSPNTLVAPPVPAATVGLPTVSANYGFLLRCFAAGGATQSQPYRVTTNANTVGGGGADQCNAGAVTPPAVPPTGYSLNPSPASFPQMIDVFGAPCQDFPITGGGVCRMNTSRATYLAVKFTVPTDINAFNGLAKQFTWLENQQDGAADEFKVYISISQCPGDFRIPTTVAAPANDPTYSLACRNFTVSPIALTTIPTRGIRYDLNGTPSNVGGNLQCGLTLGNTYYLNFILAHPEGGILPGEHRCKNNLEFCGLQVKAE